MQKRPSKKIIFQSNSLKKTWSYFPLFSLECVTFILTKYLFLVALKQADITPVYEKDDTNGKNNYRPVSILPFLSKAFEKCLHDQIYACTDSILSKAQCGFRKGYSIQYSIIAMIEK